MAKGTIVRAGVSLLSAALLVSCTAQVAKNHEFNSSSTDGLIVLGVTSSHEYAITFVQVNPDDCTLLSGFKAIDQTKRFNPARRHYVVDEFASGHWAVSNVKFSDGNRWIHEIDFTSGTTMFEARSGEFGYIGDFDFNLAGAQRSSDIEAARVFATRYPNVAVELVQSPQRNAPFSVSDDSVVSGCAATTGEAQ